MISPVAHPRIYYRNQNSFTRSTYFSALWDTRDSVILLYDQVHGKYWSYNDSARVICARFPAMQIHLNHKVNPGLTFSDAMLQSVVASLIDGGFSVNIVAPEGKTLAERCRRLCGLTV